MGQALRSISPSDIEVHMLKGEKFESYWPQISHQLDYIPQFWATWWTKDSIREGVLAGRFQCWGVGNVREIKVVTFSQIATYPANKIFQVILAFGEGIDEALPALVATYEKFCFDTGCTIAEVTGRPGWAEKLSRYGFRRQSMVLTRKLPKLEIN